MERREADVAALPHLINSGRCSLSLGPRRHQQQQQLSTGCYWTPQLEHPPVILECRVKGACGWGEGGAGIHLMGRGAAAAAVVGGEVVGVPQVMVQDDDDVRE